MDKRPEVDFSLPEAQPFHMRGGDHGVLLIHGFTGSAAHMRLLGEHLHEMGFTVRGINLPGHATNMDDMLNYSWQNWLEAAKEGVLALKKECGQVSVTGLSMGGVLALLLAEQMEITAAAPVSAPMAVQNRFMPFARVAAPFIRHISWDGESERKKLLDKRYDLGYSGFPTRSAYDLSVLIKQARSNLFAVTCPILAVQSHADETIAPSSADVIMEGVSSKVKRTLWLEEVPHVCTISREHQHIANEIGKLFREAEKA